MLKKLLLALAALVATMGIAFAAVDVNKADQAALDSVKGIGPKMSKSIVDERKKGGDFKDWADFQKRVKGVGEKNAAKLSAAGLTVNGQALPNAPASATAASAKDDKKAAAGAASAAGGKQDAKSMKTDKAVSASASASSKK